MQVSELGLAFGHVAALRDAMDVDALNRLAQVSRELRTAVDACDGYEQHFLRHERGVQRRARARHVVCHHRNVEGLSPPAGCTYRTLCRGIWVRRQLLHRRGVVPNFDEDRRALEAYRDFVVRDIRFIRALDARARLRQRDEAAENLRCMRSERQRIAGEMCRAGAIFGGTLLLTVGVGYAFFLPPRWARLWPMA